MRDVEDDLLRLGSVAREMNLSAIFAYIFDEAIEVVVEIVERMLLDVAGEFPQRVGIRQIEQSLLSAGVLPEHSRADGVFQTLIPRRFDADGVEIEFRGGRFFEKLLGVVIQILL